jgi:hypothetical protein
MRTIFFVPPGIALWFVPDFRANICLMTAQVAFSGNGFMALSFPSMKLIVGLDCFIVLCIDDTQQNKKGFQYILFLPNFSRVKHCGHFTGLPSSLRGFQ